MKSKLTIKQAYELAAPYSWLTASILPCVFGGLLSISFGYPFEPWFFCVVLAIAVLMHSSVNTLNDYADFVKGLDSKDDNVEPFDQPLLYSDLPPRTALFLGALWLALAALLGVVVVLRSGVMPLLVGIVGGGCVVFYSLGFLPISRLPFGELVSGFVMGILIPVGVVASLSGEIVIEAALYSLPFAAGIAMIMYANNCCDIEKDKAHGRKTFPILVGRDMARYFFRIALAAWVAAAAFLCWFEFRNGLFVLALSFAFGLPKIIPLFKAEVFPETRIEIMGNIVSANVAINGGVVLALACELILP